LPTEIVLAVLLHGADRVMIAFVALGASGAAPLQHMVLL